MILGGDVGGTKTALGLFEETAGDPRAPLRLVREAVFPSAGAASLEEIVERFLDGDRGRVTAACLGVPGAVIDGRARTTNLPWMVDARVLARRIGAVRGALVNDLQAAAYGTLFLGPEGLVVLAEGERALFDGPVALVAAGTGLGQSMLWSDGERHHAIASEAGHASFGPGTDEEIALLRFLRERFQGHVSWERVLSGPGLRNVYDFVRRESGIAEPAWLAEQMRTGDPSAAISAAALAKQDAVCVHALRLFASLYGSEAGNAALRAVATGGVFLAGGIAPKILPALQSGEFMAAFVAKGRFEALLRTIPVRVVVEKRAAMIGAAHRALLPQSRE